MSADVLEFTGDTVVDLPPDKVLLAAVEKLDRVLVAGVDKEGKLYVAASDGDHDAALALATRAQAFLLTFCPEAD